MKIYTEIEKQKAREYSRKWRLEHPNYNKEYNNSHKNLKSKLNKRWKIKNHKKMVDYHREYLPTKKNNNGDTKNNIRVKSNYYLFKQLKHSKLKNYEIHHCFGYENHKNFIYIPIDLHIKIHVFLNEHNISPDTNHFSAIVHLINECEEYTYIHT